MNIQKIFWHTSSPSEGTKDGDPTSDGLCSVSTLTNSKNKIFSNLLRLTRSVVRKSRKACLSSQQISYDSTLYMCVLSTEFASCHPCGVQIFVKQCAPESDVCALSTCFLLREEHKNSGTMTSKDIIWLPSDNYCLKANAFNYSVWHLHIHKHTSILWTTFGVQSVRHGGIYPLQHFKC